MVAAAVKSPKLPKLAKVRSVELFAAGFHRGRVYSVADLDHAVGNFRRFSGDAGRRFGLRIDPPISLGHDEEQVLLEGSGLPAAGIVTRLWRAGRKLFGDFGDVPPVIARLINQRAYRTVSVEFWPDLIDNGVSYGVTLRRVAILGGEVPQIKQLEDLPLATFDDEDDGRPEPSSVSWLVNGRSRETACGTVVCFSDVARPVRLARPRIRLADPGRIKLGWRT